MYFILAMDIPAMLGITIFSQARLNDYEIDIMFVYMLDKII